MMHSRTSSIDSGPKTADAPDDDVRSALAEIRQRGSSVDCVAINLPYGLHRAIGRPVRYFTFLREPVDRCISYWYWLYTQRSRPHTIWHWLESMDFDLRRILDSGRLPQFRNDQTRFITGSGDLDMTPEHLALAKKMIREEFAFVGAVERFADCHRILATRLGWTDLWYERLNHADRSDSSLLPDGAADVFREYNDIDAALHRWLVDSHLPGVLAGG
jgi:hypothetical protein